MRHISQLSVFNRHFLMLIIMAAHHRFLHLCGQRGARLDIDQSIHDPTITARPMLVMILVSLLFQAPDIHLRSLEKIWVDSLVHDRPWDEFVKQLHTDYQEFSLMVPLFQLPSVRD